MEAAGLHVGNARGEERKKPRAARETIDPGQARKIRQGLEHLGLANLYEFLGMKSLSSPKALCDRADEIYKDSMRTGRTDVEASTRNDLVGYCKALLQDDGQKARYDNTLAIEAMEVLKANIELAASDGVLSRQEMDALIRQARQRGVAAEDARAYIQDLAAARKWLVQSDDGELAFRDAQGLRLLFRSRRRRGRSLHLLRRASRDGVSAVRRQEPHEPRRLRELRLQDGRCAARPGPPGGGGETRSGRRFSRRPAALREGSALLARLAGGDRGSAPGRRDAAGERGGARSHRGAADGPEADRRAHRDRTLRADARPGRARRP